MEFSGLVRLAASNLLRGSMCGCVGQVVQMVGFVELVKTSSNDFVTVVVAVLKMQLPATRSSSLGLCAIVGLDASSKVGLEVGMQLAVGVAMIITCLVVSCAGPRVTAQTAKGFAACLRVPQWLCRCRMSEVSRPDGPQVRTVLSMRGLRRGDSTHRTGSIYTLMSDGGDSDAAGDTSDDRNGDHGDDDGDVVPVTGPGTVTSESRRIELSTVGLKRAKSKSSCPASPASGIVRLLQALTAQPPKQAMSFRARLISAAVNFGLTMYRFVVPSESESLLLLMRWSVMLIRRWSVLRKESLMCIASVRVMIPVGERRHGVVSMGPVSIVTRTVSLLSENFLVKRMWQYHC